jgi:hypothetical protein
VNWLFTTNWAFLSWVTVLTIRNIKSPLRSWQVIIWETSSVFIDWNLFKSSCSFVKFDCTLLCSMHWHSLADYITSIILWWKHTFWVLRLCSSMNLTSYFRLRYLNRPKMTPFELWNLLVNWFLRWLVLLQVSRSRSLSIAINKLVEIHHTSIIAA